MKSYSTHNTRGVTHLVVPFSENIPDFIKDIPSETLIAADQIKDKWTETLMEHIEDDIVTDNAEDIEETAEYIAEEPTNH